MTPTPGHSYPLEAIWLAIWMRISGNVSLRGISQCLVKWGELTGLRKTKFSPGNIRNWCLKYGFYALLRPIPKGKYVLICDESVGIGREHLMLVLAIPIQACSPVAPLRMEDVRVLDLAVQGSWKGQEVAQMNLYLEQQQAKFSHHRQILCCSDIIESMFGKYKNKGGMKMITEDVLNIAAYTEEKKLEDVQKAMQSVKIGDVKHWKTQHTTVSKLALIKKALRKSAA